MTRPRTLVTGGTRGIGARSPSRLADGRARPGARLRPRRRGGRADRGCGRDARGELHAGPARPADAPTASTVLFARGAGGPLDRGGQQRRRDVPHRRRSPRPHSRSIRRTIDLNLTCGDPGGPRRGARDEHGVRRQRRRAGQHHLRCRDARARPASTCSTPPRRPASTRSPSAWPQEVAQQGDPGGRCRARADPDDRHPRRRRRARPPRADRSD